jgi:hypothetical protein
LRCSADEIINTTVVFLQMDSVTVVIAVVVVVVVVV